MFRISQENFVYTDEMKRCGVCLAQIFGDGLQTVVMFTEIPTNPGPSVTNAIECIIEQFCHFKDLDPAEIVVVERYLTHPDDLDTVSILPTGTNWRRMSANEAKPLLVALRG